MRHRRGRIPQTLHARDHRAQLTTRQLASDGRAVRRCLTDTPGRSVAVVLLVESLPSLIMTIPAARDAGGAGRVSQSDASDYGADDAGWLRSIFQCHTRRDRSTTRVGRHGFGHETHLALSLARFSSALVDTEDLAAGLDEREATLTFLRSQPLRGLCRDHRHDLEFLRRANRHFGTAGSADDFCRSARGDAARVDFGGRLRVTGALDSTRRALNSAPAAPGMQPPGVEVVIGRPLR